MPHNLEKYFKSNKELWNQKTAIHKTSDFYDLEGFKKGKNVLNEIELSELGDVKGKSLLHLQCHFGLDSMSWSRLGAKVTAVDFSDEAIKTAQQIKGEAGLDTEFVCSNVYELKDNLNEQFDIVFTSYGVGGIVGPVLAGMVQDAGMSFLYAFIPAAIMCFIASGIAFIYKPAVEKK